MELEDIALKYFAKENIDSVKNFNGKVIVTIKNTEENTSLATS